MQQIILQVPVTKQLKNNAEKIALAQGFSSLQEVIKVFLSKFVENKIELNSQATVKLSEKSEKRYMLMTEDFQHNKNMYVAENTDDLMKQLNESSLS